MDSYATKNVLNSVGCSAKECKYNLDGCKCTASSIHVGGTKASTSSETECDTFKKQG